MTGLLHGWNAKPSIRHWKVTSAPLRKVKTGVLSFVCPEGPPVMTVFGAVTSTSS